MNTILNSRIILSFTTLVIASAVIIGATFALFSDTETSEGNTFVAGEVDLGIDNHSYYNGVLNPGTTWRVDYDLSDDPPRQFFNFTDVKPGDWGEDTISLHVKTNDAWLCADVTLTSDDDNLINEPEGLDGDVTDGAGNGELADAINFFWWADDGDNVFEEDETLLPAGPMGNLDVNETATVALADSTTNIWDGTGPIPGDEVRFLAKAWCYGSTLMTPYAQDGGNQQSGPDDRPVICDGSGEDNTTQSDSFTADITFRAVQSRNNPGFLCEGEEPTPTPTTPPEIVCEETDIQYATSDSNNDQGLRKNGTAVLANRSIASAAYNDPQTSGADADVGFPVGSFFSLGFPLSGNTASIVFGFANPFFPNPTGPDFQVFEVTGGVYPDEKVKAEVASTALGPWTDAIPNPGIRDEGFEMTAISAQYVRLTDVSNIALFEPEADGYDVDAVKAFCQDEGARPPLLD